MSENPLLPHAKLRQLYTLMQAAQPLLRSRRLRHLEAILAPLALHIEPGDRVLTSVAASVLTKLTAQARGEASCFTSAAYPAELLTSGLSALDLALGAATALPVDRVDPVTFALLDPASPMPHWQRAVATAQAARLPLVLLFIPAKPSDGPQKRPAPITWEALQAPARALHFPVIPVEARDAVAIYRVLQESTLRARTGGGPAAIWCSELPGTKRSSLAAMKHYLDDRGIDPELS